MIKTMSLFDVQVNKEPAPTTYNVCRFCARMRQRGIYFPFEEFEVAINSRMSVYL